MSSAGPGLAIKPAGEPLLRTRSPASPLLLETNDSVLKVGRTTPQAIRRSRPRVAFLTLVAIGTILGLTVAVYFCRLKKKNHFSARKFLRRLAGREEGEEQNSERDRFGRDTCGMIDAVEGLVPTHLLETLPFVLETPEEGTSDGPPRKRQKYGDSSSSEVDSEETPAVPPVDDWWLQPTGSETQEKVSSDPESLSSATSSSPPSQPKDFPPEFACLEQLSPLLDEDMEAVVQKSVQAFVDSAYVDSVTSENVSYLVTVEAPDSLANVAEQLVSNEAALRKLVELVEGELELALAPEKDTPSGPPVGESSADLSSNENISSHSPSIPQQMETPSTSGAERGLEHAAHSQTPSGSEKPEEEGKTTRETMSTAKEGSATREGSYEFTLAAESSSPGDTSDLETRAAEAAQAADPKEVPPEGSANLLDILRKPQRVLPCPEAKDHPYYRLPAPAAAHAEGPKMDRFDEHFVFCVAEPSAGAAAKLLPIRQILLKSEVNEVDVRHLVHHGEQLVAYAFKYLTTDLRKKSMYRAREQLCRRVLVADALWGVCQVVGSPMKREVWWDTLMVKMAGTPRDRNQPRNAQRNPFVRDLVEALQSYREETRPKPETVVKLKRAMFQAPCTVEEFRSPLWDPWRQDDKFYGKPS